MLRVGGVCSNPECRKVTLGPSKTSDKGHRLVGVAAHIRGAKGPRFDPSQSEADRHSFENGIWLCEQCASFIDKGDGKDFPVQQIETWKEWSEVAARERLERASEDLQSRALRTVIYANIPRLIHHAALNGERPPPSDFQNGVPGDRYIYDELVALRDSLKRWTLRAYEWHDAVRMLSEPVGVLVRFEGVFRTKNGPSNSRDRRDVNVSDPYKGPHVYQKAEGKRLVLPYTYKYITTSTASQAFVSGTYRMGGFAVIKDMKGDDVIATPLFIGHAATAEAVAFMDLLSHPLR